MLVSASEGIALVDTDDGRVNWLSRYTDDEPYSYGIISPDRRSALFLVSSSKDDATHYAVVDNVSLSDWRTLKSYQIGDKGNTLGLGYFEGPSGDFWACYTSQIDMISIGPVGIMGVTSLYTVGRSGKIREVPTTVSIPTDSGMFKGFPYWFSLAPGGGHVAYSACAESLGVVEPGTQETFLCIGTLTTEAFSPGHIVISAASLDDVSYGGGYAYIGGHAWLSETRIAVLVLKEEPGTVANLVHSYVCILELNNYRLKRIIGSFPAQCNPTVSPDGKHIAVLRGEMGKGSWFSIHDEDGVFVRSLPNKAGAYMASILSWRSP